MAAKGGWASRFEAAHLVKGEKAATRFILLSQADNGLLEKAARVAGLTPAVMAARLVVMALRQNAYYYEVEPVWDEQ